jgi:hypothetical protein
MTSTIKVNTVTTESGSTLTLGESGKTIALASGASQTGFGRTGTVDWQTSIKTTGFTAANGEGYFIDTSSGGFTMTLPSSPSVGDIVSFKDYARTFSTGNLTVGRGGSNMDGSASDSTFATTGLSATLIYMDATKGWSLINDDATTQIGAAFVAATGGNSTANSPCGNYKIHTFTGPGTFTVTNSGNSAGNNEVEYLVVAGGGSGSAKGPGDAGGGGGAGGFRYSSPSLAPVTYPAKPLTGTVFTNISAQAYTIQVGGGGAGNPNPGGSCAPNGNGADGTPSVFSTITSTGGGRGGYNNPRCGATGFPGGSGGGAGSGTGPGTTIAAGTGNTPPVSPPQGNPGGTFSYGGSPPNGCGGAGGGATAAGGNSVGNNTTAGGAGAGVPNAFGTSGQNCGSNYYFAGGGGGGSRAPNSPTGGLGGGGNVQTNGGCNTGGGGGGGKGTPGSDDGTNGGSGIVIIRYKFQ